MNDFLSNMNLEPMTQDAVNRLQPAALAYIGDAVYDCYVRVWVAARIAGSIHKLHTETIRYVNASAQACIVRLMEDVLTEGEQELIRRGRNVKSGRPPRNADVGDYRLATGWEALIGHLYLNGNRDRVRELISTGLHRLYQDIGLQGVRSVKKGDSES